MRDLTNAEKRTLRMLASEAYARELHEALGDLGSAFSDWRHGDIDGFQLSDFIHEFHQGASRELYIQYTRSDPGLLVARAIARHLLKESEVPKPLRSVLSVLIEYCREYAEEPDTD